jgi:hypothetical protein
MENHQDCVTLQMDLNNLALWGSTWGMQYHLQKCNSLSVTRSHTPHAFNYTLKGHILESVNTAKYLGITLSSNMSWGTHINNITAKANKILLAFCIETCRSNRKKPKVWHTNPW